MCHQLLSRTAHWDASHPRLIDFSFCANLLKHVAVYRDHIEQVSVLPPRIRFFIA